MDSRIETEVKNMKKYDLVKIGYACIGMAIGMALVALFLPALSIKMKSSNGTETQALSVWLSTASISAGSINQVGTIGLNIIIPAALLGGLFLGMIKKPLLSSAATIFGIFIPFLSSITYFSTSSQAYADTPSVKVIFGAGSVILIFALLIAIVGVILFDIKLWEKGDKAKETETEVDGYEALVKWSELYKQEIITKEEFEAKKAEILNK